MTPPAPAAIDVIAEVLYYGGLSIPVGIGMTVAFLALPEADGGRVAPRARALGPLAAMLVAISAAVHVLAAPHLDLPVVVQLITYLVVVVGLLGLSRRASRPLAVGVVAVAVVTAAVPELSFAALTVDAVVRNVMTLAHVLGALFWIGGLWVLATVGLLARRADPGVREWSRIWERFTTVALWSVGALIVSGSWLAWTHVGTPGQLLTTPYGRYLAIKLVVVVLMMAAGAYNVRVLMPRIAVAQRAGDERSAVRIAAHHFPVVVAVESALALAVLVIVPFLRGSARVEAGWPTAGGFDASVFGTGVVLMALVALSLRFGSRTPVDRRP